MDLSNHRCLRVKVEDTVSVPANSEIVTAANVLDKCEGGPKSTLDGDQVGEEPWLRQKKKDVGLAREFQPKECEHQDQQRSLSIYYFIFI